MKIFKKIHVCNFLQEYWVAHSFVKLFEFNRQRITILININSNYYYTYIHIVLLLLTTAYVKNRKKIIKKRIIFLLFKKKNYWNKQFRRQTFYKKKNNSAILNFIMKENNRFQTYCKLKCKYIGKNLLNNLLKMRKQFKPNYINKTELPYKIKVFNMFTLLDRSYVYVWRQFYTILRNHLWSLKSTQYFMSTLKIFFLSLFLVNAQLLGEQLAYLFQRSRKHWPIIRTIKHLLKIMGWFAPNYSNIRIQVKGPIQDSERTRQITLGTTSIILATFTQAVDFSISHAATAFGVLGIKIWIIK